MAKKAAIKRTRMTDHEVDAFIKQYGKAHDLKGKELDTRLRHVAATRLAALARHAKSHAPKAKAKKAPKAKAKTVPHKKAA